MVTLWSRALARYVRRAELRTCAPLKKYLYVFTADIVIYRFSSKGIQHTLSLSFHIPRETQSTTALLNSQSLESFHFFIQALMAALDLHSNTGLTPHSSLPILSCSEKHCHNTIKQSSVPKAYQKWYSLWISPLKASFLLQ